MKTHSAEIQPGRRQGSRDRWFPEFTLAPCLALLLPLGAALGAAPLSDLSFSEGSGVATTNAGSLGGLGTFARQGGFPVFAPNAPVGSSAPAGNGGAGDFGNIMAGDDGGRAVDFPGALGPLSGFTVCGWVNCRNLTVGGGGNRIAFALVAPNSSGFDLVHLANGSLQLGVNQWPDGTPALSSAGRITADPNVGAANWVFFAVTYDGTLASGQVNFYFGDGDTPAALDVTRDYNRGTLPATGSLTIGNFGTVVGARNETGPAGGSRCFRGLLDEIQVFPEVLTLEQIQAAQTRPALPPPPLAFVSEPVDRAVLAGQPATFTTAVTGGFPISYQWQRSSNNIPDATNASYTLAAATVGDNGARFRVLVSNPVSSLTSSNATLFVNSDGAPPWVVALTPLSLTNLLVSFSEPVEQGSAEEPWNFLLEGGTLFTYSAVLQTNLTNVLLTTDLMVTGAVYTLTVQYVTDRALPFPNMMEPTNVVFTAYMPPPFPTPIIELGLNEGTGTNTVNAGSAGGSLGLSTPAPYWTNNVPAGVGGARSVDFQTTTGNYFIESPANYPQLTGLTRFTITGWVNNRNSTEGGGGNRIVTWINNGGNGVDLVYKSDGSLQIGINQWPDGVPSRSTAGRITTDAGAAAANWRFFAVTYDSTLASGHVKFYFGSTAADATLDVARDYSRGAVGASISRLCLGAFNIATRNSSTWNRMFRGLIDEVKVFGQALTLEEVLNVQRGGATGTAPGFALEPVSQTVAEGQPVTFSVVVTGTPPITLQWQRNSNNIPEATGLGYTLPAASLADHGAAFRVVVTNLWGQVVSSNALLTVVADEVPPTVLAVTTARTARNLTNLTVRFSEPVETGSAEEPGHYVLDGGLATYTAVLQPDLVTVLLTIDPLTPEATHTLSIAGVTDRSASRNPMVATNWVFTGPVLRLPPLVEMRFEEGAGTSTTNSGLLGGTAPFAQQTGYPVFSASVPAGAWAPAVNDRAVDFGSIAAGEGARALDLSTATGPGGTLGALSAFTVCGWVNARDLNEGYGGNRIAFALAAQNGPGFDVVQVASGALRIGINQWPDAAGGGGPFSSAGKITADPQAGAANWVFFAVSYDSAVNGGEVRYYFGTPEQAAQLDVAAAYARGPIVTSGKLTVGNFSTVDTGARTALGPNGPSRVFRGLIDELQVFDDALSLEEIRQFQVATPAAPTLAIERDGTELVISWDSPARFQLRYRAEVHQGAWQDETTVPVVNGTWWTVRVPFTESTRFFRLESR